MKRSSRFTLGSIALSVATAIAFVAATTGSLAWYAYSRTVLVSYVGTSVAKSALLNVGIVDDSNWLTTSSLEKYELERESIGGHSIVFARSSNGLDYHAINDYLFWSPYAVNLLYPVTTQNRALSKNKTDTLTLYKSPDYGDTNLTTVASTGDYVRIPLAFQTEQKDNSSASDAYVWLTDLTIQASGQNIDRAVRLYIEGSEYHFLMKPEARAAGNGYTNVGGLLDLDGDGTYDYDPSSGKTDSGKEYYYGEHTGDLTYSDTKYDKPIDEADYDNVNGLSSSEQSASTFYAKHHQKAYTVNLNGVEPKKAWYYTFGDVRPNLDTGGRYTEGVNGAPGIPITKIEKVAANSSTAIGYATFTIFIEGWDHSVIDKSAGYSFNLGLKFEVNRT